MNAEHWQEGLWISPCGQSMPVTEHLQTLSQYPEKFSLSRSEVPISADIGTLRAIALQLIRDGWIRLRLFELTFLIEVYSIEKSRAIITNLMTMLSSSQDYEHLVIKEHITRMTYRCSVREFIHDLPVRVVNDIDWAL
jgi:hypothetical protein